MTETIKIDGPFGEADDSQDETICQGETSGETSSDFRKRTIAHVVQCNSRRLTLEASVQTNKAEMANHWSVGQLISVTVGDHRVIGQTESIETRQDHWVTGQPNDVIINVELIGEITQTADGPKFNTGISNFPQMGCAAHRVRSSDLAAIYENNAESTIAIGNLTQDTSIEAKIDFEKLLSRHFAVVGSTGVGKSTAVCMMIRKIVTARKDLRVLMLDPHNEFASAFQEQAIIINDKNLVLPFWLFSFEEIAEVIFRGQHGLNEEKELLRDLIVSAKERYQSGSNEKSPRLKRATETQRINADTPVPYRIPELIKLIEERLGLLDNKSEKPYLKRLADRIGTISNDGRFQFMFDPIACGGDRLSDVITHLFRVPIDNKPIAVIEMSGLPSEVVSSVVSVLCRLAFDVSLSSQGGIETLVVCEEAHRYIPADRDSGFWPVQQAIGRIAKEGRKYGTYLGIISQRPAELDQTILSQCNTIFALRLSNRKDQTIIAGAFTGGVQSTIEFLPSIANKECVVFGEAVYSPMRITFETLPDSAVPGARFKETQNAVRGGKSVNIGAVISHLRRSGMGMLDDSGFGGFAESHEAPISQRETAAAPADPTRNTALPDLSVPTYYEDESNHRLQGGWPSEGSPTSSFRNGSTDQRESDLAARYRQLLDRN